MNTEKRKRNTAPSQKRIIEYWKSQPSLPCDVTIDWDTAHEKCWCCGYSDPEFPEYTTERAHIIPHALGGSSEPENFVLLCPECHVDSPDVNDPMAMWDYFKLKNYSMDTGNKKYTIDPYDMLEHYIWTLKQYLPVLNPETKSDAGTFHSELLRRIEGFIDQTSTHGFNYVSIGTRLWYFKQIVEDVKKGALKILYSDEYYKKLGLV